MLKLKRLDAIQGRTSMDAFFTIPLTRHGFVKATCIPRCSTHLRDPAMNVHPQEAAGYSPTYPITKTLRLYCCRGLGVIFRCV